ncbi:MAG: Fe-S cluster assembly protein IscX [Nitrospiraceae bacterium]
MDLTWQDTEELGIQLLEAHPDVDPLTVRFTDLHSWITALPGFKDDPKKSNEKLLESIQMAWWQEYKDAQ